MNPELLIHAGRTVFGVNWQTSVAKAIGVSSRTVRYWAAGDRPIPAWVRHQLVAAFKAHERTLAKMRAKLEGRDDDVRTLPLHPGARLRIDYMKPLGIDEAALAKSLDLPLTLVGEVLDGDASVSLGFAQRLAAATGTSPSYWLQVQTDHDVARAEPIDDIVNITPLRGLKSSGYEDA